MELPPRHRIGFRGITVGIVLAAGAGSRYGMPKALVRDGGGWSWVGRACDTLRSGGCQRVIVVLGAESHRAVGLVPGWAEVVVAEEWRQGLSESLRAGLRAAEQTGAGAAVIIPVDTPTMPAGVVRRLLSRVDGLEQANALRQATYAGAPGHPVVMGREHWHEAARTATGDRGARAYLAAHGAEAVECRDLWDGADVDRPATQPGSPDVR